MLQKPDHNILRYVILNSLTRKRILHSYCPKHTTVLTSETNHDGYYAFPSKYFKILRHMTHLQSYGT